MKRVIASMLIALLVVVPLGAQLAGDGTATNPWHPMSCDPVQAAKDVRASLAFYGRTDDSYWIGFTKVINPFGDGFYCGWNRYFEDRADPTNQGSADRSHAKLPALHLAPVDTLPTTPPTVPVSPITPVDFSPVLGAITTSHDDLSAQSERIFANLTAQIMAVSNQVAIVEARQQPITPPPVAVPQQGIMGALGTIFTNPAVLGAIATFVTCKASGKC